MDEINEWTDAQRRMIDLSEGLSAEQAGRHVPACPDWTVRDLLAHMIGLDADVLRGDEPDDHNSEWTQRQVDERADRDVPALLDEWRALTTPMQDWMRANNTRPMADAVIHEQDLRGAVGVSGAQDNAGLAAMRDRFSRSLGEKVAGLSGDLAPLALVGGSWSWASAGEPSAAGVVVEATDFELARALLSRRSADQLRRWTSRGDIEPYLDAFTALGPLPDVDLSE